MKWKALLLTAVVAAGAGSSCSSSTASEPVEPEKCADGKGVWMEDDNGVSEWLDPDETAVTVRLCVAEGGRVLDMEVD